MMYFMVGQLGLTICLLYPTEGVDLVNVFCQRLDITHMRCTMLFLLLSSFLILNSLSFARYSDWNQGFIHLVLFFRTFPLLYIIDSSSAPRGGGDLKLLWILDIYLPLHTWVASGSISML